jgi:hypothetical protein
MSENRTSKTAHAAGGQTRLRRGNVANPDTLIMMPNGQTMIL